MNRGKRVRISSVAPRRIMNKRIKKKVSQYKCPKCGCKNGIVAHFIDGKINKQLFVYCSGCNWEYKLKDEKED